MSRIRTRTAMGLALGAMLLTMAPAAVASPTAVTATGATSTPSRAATSPALAGYYHWAWVTVRQPSMTYTPAAIDRGNSAGRRNTVEHLGTGQWRVTFKGLGDNGGVAHVTPLATQARICEVVAWGRGAGSGTDEIVLVSCVRMSNATPVNTMFSVSYHATNDDAGPLAYLYYTNTDEEDASAQYSYNSAAGTNHISRSDTGRFAVTLGNLGLPGGHPDVTARSTFGADAATCNVQGWDGFDDEGINVLCWDHLRNPVNTEFTLTFTDRQGLKGHGTGRIAYLWANRETTASYVPDATYRYSSAAKSPRITRQGVGRYTVKLKGMPIGGAAQVAAYSQEPVRCQLGSIRTNGTPQLVQVRCYGLDGGPVDSRFNLSYER